ncbi:TetR/AcrR family transcriptional regulator [Salinithrix halophila]|uniref:TetR/AcrR family transcriptional regulator n=1 Tax=Salinithrix halophila TaxID=1485204 RepID=A0ABV8JGR3_9BACL
MSKKMDRRIKRTRENIKKAMLELIADKGFQAVTVRDLTDRAGINRGTFYLHFQDKYDLLEQCVEEEVQALFQIMKPKPGEPSTPLNEQALERCFQYYWDHKGFYQTMMGQVPQLRDLIFKAHREQANKLAEKSKVHPSRLPVDPDIVISYTLHSMLGVTMWWLENDMPYPPCQMAKQLNWLVSHHVNDLKSF